MFFFFFFLNSPCKYFSLFVMSIFLSKVIQLSKYNTFWRFCSFLHSIQNNIFSYSAHPAYSYQSSVALYYKWIDFSKHIFVFLHNAIYQFTTHFSCRYLDSLICKCFQIRLWFLLFTKCLVQSDTQHKLWSDGTRYVVEKFCNSSVLSSFIIIQFSIGSSQ